ncbi:MAG TPA: DUF3881 family protein [Pyrinomonadaceae bacterium]|jgi:hypothetical protein
MEIAFDAIGFEIPNENAFQDLAEAVGRRGVASRLARKNGVLHGRCLKFGAGLEVWTHFYESGKGELVYADCRPAFRARHAQKISPWALTESDREGTSVIHGFIEDTNAEVLFQLQNLTEVGTRFLEQATLRVGLCGLAYRAGISAKKKKTGWLSYDESALSVIEEENYWKVAGRVIAFDALKNPQSGSELYWIYVETGAARLEVLVNRRALRGKTPSVGAFLEADVWLQGHILSEAGKTNGYEGVDVSASPADFWKSLRKPN